MGGITIRIGQYGDGIAPGTAIGAGINQICEVETTAEPFPPVGDIFILNSAKETDIIKIKRGTDSTGDD